MSGKDLDSQLNGELSSQLETAVVDPKFALPEVKIADGLKYQTADNLAVADLVSY